MTGPMRVFIVDDEALARERLKSLLVDCSEKVPLTLVGEAANGFEALTRLQQQGADVLLLDIQMPEMDGLEFAGHLQHLPHPPLVIFVTAHNEYAVQAFELAAVDYLMKPVRLERLEAALERAQAQRGARQSLPPSPSRKHLSVTERGRVLLVPLDHIRYLKAELKYITIVTPEKEYLLEGALTQLENEFPDRFIRIHRNCLVSQHELSGFEKGADADGETHWLAVLKSGDHLPVSRRQWHVLRERFRQL